jgi:spore maturation protein CgeB
VSLFREDHSIIYFDPGGSLTNKLAFYLANDKERFRIAEAGYEEVLNKHKYTDRLKVIINKFNRIK